MLSTPRVSLSKLLYAITDFNDTSSFYKSYLISFAQGKFVFLWKIFPRKLFLQINELRNQINRREQGQDQDREEPESEKVFWVWGSILSLREVFWVCVFRRLMKLKFYWLWTQIWLLHYLWLSRVWHLLTHRCKFNIFIIVARKKEHYLNICERSSPLIYKITWKTLTYKSDCHIRIINTEEDHNLKSVIDSPVICYHR